MVILRPIVTCDSDGLRDLVEEVALATMMARDDVSCTVLMTTAN
jgi:hypothetical protein